MNNNSCCRNAIANINGSDKAPLLSGQVKFYQKKTCVLVSVNITGLPMSKYGFFGFHIHDGDNCKGVDFSGTGSHFNPKNMPHPVHAGDLPPLILCNKGAFMTVATDRFKVFDIIGKTVVIHSLPDDFTSQPAGNAGTKIACGIIEQR